MDKQTDSSLGKAKTLLALQFLSDFGDQITSTLLALCLLDITQSTSKVGLVYVITTAGFIIFTFLGGFLGDSMSKRNVLFCSDLGRGICVLIMIVAIKFKILSLLYLTSFLLSLLGSLHRPVKLGLWTQSVPRTHLERFNSLSETSLQTSTMIGPLIASLFIALNATLIGFAIDAVSFFICAIVFFNFSFTEPPTLVTQPKKDLLRGLKLIFRNRELFKYTSFDAILMLGHGAFNATLVVILQRDFHWAKAEFSYHLAIAAGFAVFGAWISQKKYVADLSHVVKFVACSLISSLSLGLALYLKIFPIFSILYGFCTMVSVMVLIVTKTKIQAIAVTEYPDTISSVLASRLILIKFMTLIGAGNSILFSKFLSLETTLWIHLLPIVLACLPFVMASPKIVRPPHLDAVS